MGGLLAADAATDPAQRSRIKGMIAFDTPYLGMHPHVVISGIASLFPKDDKEKKKEPTEREMNNENKVQMVDEGVTEDWELFKKNMNKPHARSSHSSHSTHSHSSASTSYYSLSPSPSAHTLPSPSPPPSPMPSSPQRVPFIDRTLDFVSSHAEDQLVRWIRKHSDDPFGAGKRWVVEHCQFGVCMFDPSGLKERYARLVKWDGAWVNYWTETVARTGTAGGSGEVTEGAVDDGGDQLNSKPSLDSRASSPPPHSSNESDNASGESPVFGPLTKSDTKSARKADEKAAKARAKAARKAEKERARESKSKRPARHFIVLPNGLGRALGGSERWEHVQIGGVDDEVAAHCGLFIPGQNLEYEALVERVAKKVMEWCEGM